MESKAELNRIIDEELGRWSQYVLTRLAAEIQKRKLVLSGELLKSLQTEVLKASAENVGKMKLAFVEAGRIRDMKSVHYKKLPPISAIELFVQEIGVSKFTYVPGYVGTKKIPTESTAIRRIAWGIAKSKLRKNETVPKKWFAKPFYSTINTLIDNLVTRYASTTGQVIGGAFTDL